MKKVLVTLVAGIALVACGGNKENKETTTETATTAASSLSSNPDYQKGLELVGKSDCLTCHKANEKNIGPAYKDVAAKYENTDENVKMLAEKNYQRRKRQLGRYSNDCSSSIVTRRCGGDGEVCFTFKKIGS